MLFGKDN